MTAAELLHLVKQNRLLGVLGAQVPLDTCTLKIDTKACATLEAVRQELRDFGPTQGWLCFQSKLTRFLQGEPLPEAGVVLYGEVKGQDDRSLHIQQDGEGGWILTCYQEQRDGETHLAEDLCLIAEAHPGDPPYTRYDLNYRVYWGGTDYEQDDDGQGWRQIAAVFVGF